MGIENRYWTKEKIIVHIEFWPDGKTVSVRLDNDETRYNIPKDLAMKLFYPAP